MVAESPTLETVAFIDPIQLPQRDAPLDTVKTADTRLIFIVTLIAPLHGRHRPEDARDVARMRQEAMDLAKDLAMESTSTRRLRCEHLQRVVQSSYCIQGELALSFDLADVHSFQKIIHWAS
jgi:hypothetical protein